jgi:hypothetical protein
VAEKKALFSALTPKHRFRDVGGEERHPALLAASGAAWARLTEGLGAALRALLGAKRAAAEDDLFLALAGGGGAGGGGEAARQRRTALLSRGRVPLGDLIAAIAAAAAGEGAAAAVAEAARLFCPGATALSWSNLCVCPPPHWRTRPAPSLASAALLTHLPTNPLPPSSLLFSFARS